MFWGPAGLLYANGAVAGAYGPRLLLNVQGVEQFLRLKDSLVHQDFADAPRVVLVLLLHVVVNIDHFGRYVLDQDFSDVCLGRSLRLLLGLFR
jgi:hypothetical protein